MLVARRVTEVDDGAVPEASFEEDDATRPYHLDITELTRLDRIAAAAPFYPEAALAEVLIRFGDDRKRAAAIAHLMERARPGTVPL